LQEANDVLDKIKEEVKNNLRKKQESCSRLCFMGYESLVIFLREILKRKTLCISQLFPGLDTIDISENCIVSIKRSNSQLVLSRPVTLFLANKPLTLDTWVLDLENALIQTFKEKIQKINFSDEVWWSFEDDVQVLVTSQMIYFSQNISDPLLQSKLQKTLENLISYIKTGYLYLEKLSVVLICQINLLELMKTDPICWDFSLKYSTSPVLQLSVLNNTIEFCYEFHNISEFAYIPTPLTEKAMLNIINCVVTYQTGLLSGPGNSGKTSTLKELAFYCGKGICFWTAVKEITFNVLISIVSGCAAGGFWGVIEEIQNIDVPVFSTIAYYLSDIVQKLKINQTKLMISDRILKVKPGFSIFFTSSHINHIPSHLIETFRTVNIIQPQFKQIINIKIQALGYQESFCSKIYTVFHLLSCNFEGINGEKSFESAQKSITSLNNLIALLPHEASDADLALAFYKLYSTEFSLTGKSILEEILSSVFPDWGRALSTTTIEDYFKKSGLESNKDLLKQCESLLSMLKTNRKWLIITGPACSGKSSLIAVSAAAYSELIKKSFLIHKLSSSNSEILMRLVSICDKITDNKYSYCSYPVGPTDVPAANDWVVIDCRMASDWNTLNYISKGEGFSNAARRLHVPEGLRLFIESENLNEFTPGDIKNCSIININEEYLSPKTIFENLIAKMDYKEIQQLYPPLFPLLQSVYDSLTETYFNYSLKIWTIQLCRLISKMVKESKSLMSRKYDSLYTQINKPVKLNKKKNILGTSTLANSIVITDSYIPQKIDKKGEIVLNTLEFLNLSTKPAPINTKAMYEAIFLSAVIYTFGTCAKDQEKFNKVILDFLNTQELDFAGNIKDKIKVKSVFDVCYVIDTQEWLEWNEELIKDRKSIVKRQLTLRRSTRALIEITKSLDSIYITTAESKKQVYWLSYYLNSGISSILIGQHQCGKTLLANSILKKQLSQGYLGYLPISLTGNTTVSHIQSMICASLDQVKEYYYSCVGGIKQYVYIDDLNDATNDIYELLRFWKENHGWYNPDFCYIGHMEILAVHGYSANRTLYPRALRHFNIIYKESYSDSDISHIFRSTLDSDTISIENSKDDLDSILDHTVDLYKKLYFKVHKISSEKYGCNLSLTLFMLALRKLSEFESIDTVEIEEGIKYVTYVFNSYVASSVNKNMKELHDIINAGYAEFISHFKDKVSDAASIESKSILVDGSLFKDALSEYITLDKSTLASVIQRFDADVWKVKGSNFDQTKHLHYVFYKPEETLGRYILTYMRLLFDLKDCNNCSLLCSESSNKVLKSLIYTASETLSIPIYNFTQVQTHSKDLSSITEFYIPIETKFLLKEVINQAGILNKLSIVLIEIQDQVPEFYVTTVLEIFNDLFSASAFKIPSCYLYYKEVVDKIKKNGIDFKSIYDEQVMMSALQKIKENLKIVIVFQTEFGEFTRTSDLGVLEQLKHRYRALFNCSKLICYDSINVPYMILEGIVVEGKVLDKWMNPNNRSIYMDFYTKYRELQGNSFTGYLQLEKLCYLASEIQNKNKKRFDKRIDKLKNCIACVDQIDSEIESFGSKIEEINKKVQSFMVELSELNQRRELIVAKNNIIHQSSYVPDFVKNFQNEKQAFLDTLDKSRANFEESREIFINNKAEFSELASLTSQQPGLVICAGYLQCLITPKLKLPQVVAIETFEPLAKPFINNLAFNFNTVSKKIKKIQVENQFSIENIVSNPLFSSFNGLKGLKSYKILANLIESLIKYKRSYDDLTKIKQDWIKTEEIFPIQIKEAIDIASNKLLAQILEIDKKIKFYKEEISKLRRNNENLEKIQPKAHIIIRNLNQKKIKWIEEITYLEKTKQGLYGKSVFLAFSILLINSLPYSRRQVLLEEASNLITLRDSTFPGIPKYPSVYHKQLEDLQTCGKEWKGCHALSTSSYFRATIASILSVFKYNLPYPMVIDPFKVFLEFIISEEQDDLTIITLDAQFERIVDRLMTEGKAGLIINPSASVYTALRNIINARVKYCISRSRNLPCDSLSIRIANQTIKFNPNFRLYICCDQCPKESTETFTIFSMDLEGSDWKSLVYCKLKQELDPIEYNKLDSIKNSFATKTQNQALTEEKELIKMLNKNYIANNSIDFMEFFQKISKSIYINELDVAKLQKSITKQEIDLDPADCQDLLEELCRFDKTLTFTGTLTSPYVLPRNTFVDMVLDTVREITHNSPDLGLKHIAYYSDVIIYMLFTWVYSSMPRHESLVFMAYFAMIKYLDVTPEYTDLIAQILKDINQPSTLSAQEVMSQLEQKYLNLLPDGFSINNIKKIENCSLYRDCRLPKSTPSAIKLFIYSKMRLDMMPMVVHEILIDLMGPRYSFLYPPFFNRLALYIESPRPIVIIYEETSPIEFIKIECEQMAIHLQVLQPLLRPNIEAFRKDTLQMNCKNLLKPLQQKVEFKKWIVIEKANVVNPNEIEALIKAVCQAIVNPLCKVIFIINGCIDKVPHLAPIVDMSYKIYFKSPETVKNRIQDWICWWDKEYYLKNRKELIEKYHDHLTSSPSTSKLFSIKSFKNKELAHKLSSGLLFSDEVTNIISLENAEESHEPDILTDLPYNISLFISLVYLRSRYSGHATLSYTDIAHVLQELFPLISKTDPSQRLLIIKTFVRTFWPEDLGEILDLVLSNTGSISLLIDGKSLVYPLYTNSNKTSYETIQTLLDLTASEDHLSVAGLEHVYIKDKNAKTGADLLKFIPKCLQMIKDSVLNTIKSDLSIPETIRTAQELESKVLHYKSLIPEFNMSIKTFSADVLLFLQHELEDYRILYSSISHTLKLISQYMTYDNSLLTQSDLKILKSLLKDKVPKQWKESQPYCLKNFLKATDWLKCLGGIFTATLVGDFRACYKPHRFFYLIVRSARCFRISLVARPFNGGVSGIGIYRGRIHNNKLIECDKVHIFSKLTIEIDTVQRLDTNYLFLDLGLYDNLVKIPVFGSDELVFLCSSDLKQRYCDYKRIYLDILYPNT
jgi:Hydrolytic ATP binding site of dynein motor region/P-loop containing dynein motor region/Dynein heavy chain AAA lid domain